MCKVFSSDKKRNYSKLTVNELNRERFQKIYQQLYEFGTNNSLKIKVILITKADGANSKSCDNESFWCLRKEKSGNLNAGLSMYA